MKIYERFLVWIPCSCPFVNADPTVEKVVITPACVRGECGPTLVRASGREQVLEKHSASTAS